MFQYAFGRALALSKRTELILDTDDFFDYPLHNGFELKNVFGITTRKIKRQELFKALGWRGIAGFHRKLTRRRYLLLRGRKILAESHFRYPPSALDVDNDCYVFGYWQSEQYFSSFADVIRADFTFRPPLSETNQFHLETIKSCESVSLHVRRGDYVSSRKTNAIHGVCTLDYYYSAIDFLSKSCHQPVFFIFSDDSEWVKKNLKIGFPCHYIENNIGKESYNDMRLMASCCHHIIANSSFSWWGAWLNPSETKIVVAPQHWFKKDRFDIANRIPETWIRI